MSSALPASSIKSLSWARPGCGESPLVGSHFAWIWVLNVVVWLTAFVVGAVWRLRRDTARV
jgi:hypothetical protein